MPTLFFFFSVLSLCLFFLLLGYPFYFLFLGVLFSSSSSCYCFFCIFVFFLPWYITSVVDWALKTSVCLSVCLSICLSIYQSSEVILSGRLGYKPTMNLSIYLSIYLSRSIYLDLSIYSSSPSSSFFFLFFVVFSPSLSSYHRSIFSKWVFL